MTCGQGDPPRAPSPAAGVAEQGAPRHGPAHALFTLKGLRKAYANGTLALDGLDLTVHEGEFLALLGPSGCGKSTALKIIAGLSQPTAGIVTRTPAGGPDTRPGRGDIGFVFQEPTLMPWASLLANVRLPLDLAGVPRREGDARAAEMIGRIGLAGFETAYPRELSGGMRMRASLARALVTRPRLLLMDEPFAALDEITRFRLNDDLIALRRDAGCTVVFVTHSIYESVYLASRIVVLSARPGHAVAEIEITPDEPREAAFRGSALYADYCRRVLAEVEAAIASPPRRSAA